MMGRENELGLLSRRLILKELHRQFVRIRMETAFELVHEERFVVIVVDEERHQDNKPLRALGFVFERKDVLDMAMMNR